MSAESSANLQVPICESSRVLTPGWAGGTRRRSAVVKSSAESAGVLDPLLLWLPGREDSIEPRLKPDFFLSDFCWIAGVLCPDARADGAAVESGESVTR